MSRKRPKRGARAENHGQEKIVAGLPNELLLEVRDYLPPMERVSISQVCSKWRRISLSTPRLWSRIAFFSSRHWDRCACSSCRSTGSSSRKFNIFRPVPNTNNASFFEELLLRSADLPLDVTLLLGTECGDRQTTCFKLLVPHSNRLARIHFESGEGADLDGLVRHCKLLPALRTLTAGFDDCEIEYYDIPRRRYPGTPFPVPNQIHVGAAFGHYSGFFRGTAVLSVQELTLTPVYVRVASRDLAMCPNVVRLNLVMAQFSTRGTPHSVAAEFRKLANLIAQVREVCLLDIPVALEGYILKSFNDARHRHLILAYQGRPRVAGSSWWTSLPSPSDVLADAVRLTLRLREGVYEIDVSDALDRRREVLLDSSTIRMAPGLWDCYVCGKTIASATVDALAWEYFKTGLPDVCDVPDLTLVVARSPDELKTVSFAPFSSLRKLRIDSLRSGLRLDDAVLRRLVKSRAAGGGKPAELSISALARVADEAALSQLASRVAIE